MPNPKTQATPGPWRVGNVNGTEPEVWANDFECVAQVCEDQRALANARLIAAAPQMREALEAVLSLLTYADSDGRMLTGDNRDEYTTRVEPMIRAALRAAIGEPE